MSFGDTSRTNVSTLNTRDEKNKIKYINFISNLSYTPRFTKYMEPFCDGITIIDAKSAVSKTFSVADVNKQVPDDCYDPDLGDADDEEDTSLGFIIKEYEYPTKFTMKVSRPETLFFYDPFADWKKAEDVASYSVWHAQEAMLVHMLHLKDSGDPSVTPPTYPLVVTISHTPCSV